MATRTISGTAVALVTPFTQNGAIDSEALQRLVAFHVDAGTDLLIPCGTTGESPTLSDKEQTTIIRIVVEAAGGKVMVASGAGTNNTNHAVTLARAAEQAGAAAILSVAPYYNKPSQEGIYQHYSHVARAVSVPVILYNVPGRCGCNIAASTILRLARDFDNILAVKEASENFTQISELLEERPAGFSVLTGEDSLILPFMAMGGDGVVSVAANEVPREISMLVEAAREGRMDEARALNSRYRRLMKLNFIESNPVPVKYALWRMGLIGESCRLPLVPMAAENRAAMDEELNRLSLLSPAPCC